MEMEEETAKIKEKQIRNVHRMVQAVVKECQPEKVICSPDAAAWSEITPVTSNGGETKRLMVILTAKGCTWAKTGGPCTMCNYWIKRHNAVTAEDLVSQFTSEIAKYNLSKEGITYICIFCSGSFLSDAEVPEEARITIMRKIAQLSSIEKVMIEARAEHVEKNKVMQLKKVLGEKILEVGVGLESADDFIRQVCINKGLPRKTFERALRILKECRSQLLAYVLIKPPFLTEKEAIEDAVNTARYVFEVAEKVRIRTVVDFEAIHVKAPSLVYQLYKKDMFRCAWLWSILDIVTKVSGLGRVQVLLSPEGYAWHQLPRNCRKCTPQIIEKISQYNVHQDVNEFQRLDCDCKNQWLKELDKKMEPLPERVEIMLKKVQGEIHDRR
ncbi:MAG: archaeosine biosynthesis radical SAM protein RaSEA [Theionarchaea archaeon]|nr:MAG: hypothetical protein AYK18_01400 [Theionarchaea archaeon DG-70]MBU7011648.1 archaeosine biosynthesis radical SAM protein RaSEA [Theionarchaea archaeon]